MNETMCVCVCVCLYMYVCLCMSVYVLECNVSLYACMYACVCNIMCVCVLRYRVIQEESALLWEMIVWVILSKKVHTNMGSDFELLRSYGHFLIPVHALMWTALTEPAGGLWLTARIASINFASWLAHITSAVHNGASACVGAGGVIFKNQL